MHNLFVPTFAIIRNIYDLFSEYLNIFEWFVKRNHSIIII